MKWTPWEDYKKEIEILPIEEPPCKFCLYWKPFVQYSKEGNFLGVACCIVAEMWGDFSCYKSKELS